MRRARAVVLGFVTAGVVSMALVALLQRTSLAFTIGVAPAIPAVPLRAGDPAFHRPIYVPDDASFDRTVPAATPIAVCVRNAGPRRVALYGNADAAARTSTAATNGRPAHVDM